VQIILAVLAVALYCVLVWAFFVYVAKYLAAALLSIGLIVALFDRFHACLVPHGAHERTLPPEPAYREYLYDRGWRVLRGIATNGFRMAWEHVEIANRGAMMLFSDMALVTWPLGVVAYASLGAAIICGAAIHVAVTLVHGTILGVGASLWMLAAWTLRAIERGGRLIRRASFVCPHADCHLPMAIPLYRCAACAAEHRRLLPGRYGVLRRRCRCGRKLPTLMMFGRDTVPAFCPQPKCDRPLSAVIGTARNVHFAVVGGASAGKTVYMIAAVRALSALDDVRVRFLDSRDERQFKQIARRFDGGAAAEKTTPGSPTAFLLNVQTNDKETLVYLYDAAGEMYAGSESLRQQNYFQTATAVILIVDPFSLDRVQAELGEELNEMRPLLRPSEQRPQECYDRVALLLRERQGEHIGSVPLAIVLTKVDAFDLQSEIDAIEAESIATPQQGTVEGSRAVRTWLLRHEEGNLVRSAESDFVSVGYFACSALGRVADASSAPLRGHGVLQPLAWIAGHAGIDPDGRWREPLRNATRQRITNRVAEAPEEAAS